MQAEEFRDLVAGVGDTYLCQFLGVGAATFRRWKTGKARIPEAVIKLLHIKLDGDLSSIGGKDWEGFAINRDGTLTLPLFHRPIPPRRIAAMFFFEHEQRASDLERAHADINALRLELSAEQEKTAYYRRQLKEAGTLYSILHK